MMVQDIKLLLNTENLYFSVPKRTLTALPKSACPELFFEKIHRKTISKFYGNDNISAIITGIRRQARNWVQRL
jgi:hypothetical protein